jgi:hypothetical protein
MQLLRKSINLMMETCRRGNIYKKKWQRSRWQEVASQWLAIQIHRQPVQEDDKI